MEIKKYYCDRCNKEITKRKIKFLEWLFGVDVVQHGLVTFRLEQKKKCKHEICAKCFVDFQKWFNKLDKEVR